LPTTANANQATISILPGFSTANQKNLQPTDISAHPFGLWFANATTLYVSDEGAGSASFDTNGNMIAGSTHVALNMDGGLQKWSLVNGTWQLDYTLTNGLNLGQTYSVAASATLGSYPTGLNGTGSPGNGTGHNWAVANDGLRNITGRVNADGSVTIYGVTSTVSGATDQGADPNEVVAITDDINATSLPGTEAFSVIDAPQNGTVYRGVAITPQVVPEPTSAVLLGMGALSVFGLRRRRTA
jgi:hypothetical protein